MLIVDFNSKSMIKNIKIFTFIASFIPLIRLLYLAMNEALGANPIEFIERSTGFWGLIFLLLTLSMTPAKKLFGFDWCIKLRRMLGLYMFFYACLHVITYFWLDHWFDLIEISKDITKHPFVLVGFVAFIFSIPLAITSTKGMMRRLGGRWKILHKLTYLIGVLVILHFLWLVKKDLTEPLIYGSVFFFLISLRIAYRYRNNLRSLFSW